MLGEMVIGTLVNIAVILVHLAATFLLVSFVRPLAHRLASFPRMRLTLALLVTSSVLLIAHLVEVSLWAGVFLYRELVPTLEAAFYSAFVGYTTLGFGDLQQGEHTRLLGPMAAGSGIMMFGWTTALMIFVLQDHMPRLVRHHEE
jgi:hypothetical protein